MSSDDSTVTTGELSIKERYRDPFIAMTFFAILFFIILVVIVVFWCKKRRQTEVKTVVIQPKRRQPTASTKPKAQTNGVEAQQPSNGHSADVEAAINTNEIELNDDSVDSKTKQEEQQATTESEVRVTEELSNQHSHIDNEVRVETEEANQESDAAPQSPPSGDWQLVDKGETNPTFEKDEE